MSKMVKISLVVLGFLVVLIFVLMKFEKMKPAPSEPVSKGGVSVTAPSVSGEAVPAGSRPRFDKNLTPEQIAALYSTEWGFSAPTLKEDELALTEALFEYYICKSIQAKSFVPCNVLKLMSSTPRDQSDYWHAISDSGDYCDSVSASLQLANAYAFGRLGLDECEKYLKVMYSMEDYAKPKFWKALKFPERTFCKAIVDGWKDGGRDAACALVSAKGYISKDSCKLIFPVKNADCRLTKANDEIRDCENVLSGFQASVANDPDKCGSYLHAGCEYMLKKTPGVCDAVAKRLAELYKRYKNRPLIDTSANSS